MGLSIHIQYLAQKNMGVQQEEEQQQQPAFLSAWPVWTARITLLLAAQNARNENSVSVCNWISGFGLGDMGISGYMGGVCDYNEEDTHKSATQRNASKRSRSSRSIIQSRLLRKSVLSKQYLRDFRFGALLAVRVLHTSCSSYSLFEYLQL